MEEKRKEAGLMRRTDGRIKEIVRWERIGSRCEGGRSEGRLKEGMGEGLEKGLWKR